LFWHGYFIRDGCTSILIDYPYLILGDRSFLTTDSFLSLAIWPLSLIEFLGFGFVTDASPEFPEGKGS
jgi:hypothetical protein